MTQQNELATRQKPPVLEAIHQAKGQFEGRLPPGMTAEKFMYGLATVVQKNPALLDCEPKSVLLAAYEAAELGISLSPTLQLGFIIPYGKQAQFQLSYRGMVQKAYESGAVTSFFAEVVYENDKFERQLAPKRKVFHSPADGDRGPAIGAYALVEFKDGHLEYEYLTKEQIERHRNHSKQPDSLMWKKFWEEGWRKTPIRLLAKRLPLTNPGMEKLAEAIDKDATSDLEEPNGALQLDKDSPLLAMPKADKAAESNGGNGHAPTNGKSEVYFQVDKHFTVVTGNTYAIKDALPKIGGRPDNKTHVWTMPSARTYELIKACNEKGIIAVEVDANGTPVRLVGEEQPAEQAETLFQQ